MAKTSFFGIFQNITQKYYQIVRQPFEVDKDYFSNLGIKHFNKEFTSKYNENLFVDQDKDSGQKLINEILLNNDHFQYLTNELSILTDWIQDFKKEYQNLISLLEIENIEINKASKQYIQLEFLLYNCQTILDKIKWNKDFFESDDFKLPLQINIIDNTNLIIPEDFNFQRVNEYRPEHRFIEQEPSDSFAVVIVFRRLSEIITQLASVNRIIERIKNTQSTFVYGNAGMGKSNFSAFIYSELRKKNKPTIVISGKSFNGDPDSFDNIFMDNLLVPKNYQLEEVLAKLNKYGEQDKCRVTIIIDGLNETSFAHDGFSAIWKKSIDTFIETLKSYPYLFLVSTLRTSYISRIWVNNSIPYYQIQLNGFIGDKLRELIYKYFKEYKIDTEALIESDVFYFKTPLYLDLYCQMLNGDKTVLVKPLLGLEGFKQVFDDYINKLADKVSQKLNLITRDQVFDGIDRVSLDMVAELEAFVPKLLFYEKMEGKVVNRLDKTIGLEILQEYLIYLDENHNNKDVIIHTQQEVGGYLLAKKLIADNGNVDGVVQSKFFKDFILGNSGRYHQLKDDILKFLITQADANSLIYKNHIQLEVVKKFTLLNLQRTKVTRDSLELLSNFAGVNFNLQEVRTLLNDNSNNLYDLESNINFLFIRDKLLKLSNYEFDFVWTLYVYNNYYDFSEFLMRFINNPEELEGNENDSIIVEIAIWLSETTIRDLRDKSTRFLLQYFSSYPSLLLPSINEYSDSNRVYIQERIALVCYGVCLRLQNDKSFVNNYLGEIATSVHELQFTIEPTNPTYNYIVIDSYKHIIDLAIIKEVFVLNEENFKRLANYEFIKNDWFQINEQDRNAVPIANNWHLHGKPDPLRGDFVHYTIPRLTNRDSGNRIEHTAHIYKEIIRLGYISDDENFSDKVQSFYNGTSLLGSRLKVDRLGKKYSWIAYFNYAGYLLQQKSLDVWKNEDSAYEKHYERLSDTEIEPSYEENNSIHKKLVNDDFFVNRTVVNGDWILKPNYSILKNLFFKDDYTLLSTFIDQKLDKNYKTRSWLEVKSFFVDKDEVLEHISEIENKEFDWHDDFNGNGSLSNIYFGELFWADTIPKLKKENHCIKIKGTKEITRVVKPFEVRESGEFNFEDLGKEVTRTVSNTCCFEYEQATIDFLWKSDSEQIPTLRCEIPSPNIGKYLKLTVDSRNTKILDVNLKECYQVYSNEDNLNSEKFSYFRTDLLEQYLVDTNQVLLYQIKQHTYDNATNLKISGFRGMQFAFSALNR
ncbi:MAG: hypothetical protein ACSHXA_17260 [Polaribacter sp.]|uniref:hypothetical protein n=1 Tax=Polaribacter sp. TaxID=1920175 RepID=UPI003EF0D901